VNEDIHGAQLSESVSGPLRDQIEIRRNMDIKVNGLWYLPASEQEEQISAGARPYQVRFADPTSSSVQSASGPGTYLIAPGIRLQYSRNAEDGDKGTILNRGSIEWIRATGQYDQNNREKLLVPLQRPLKLPSGVNTFRMAWVAGGSALWIITTETVRRIDFDTTELKESSWKRAEFNADSAPKDLLKEAGNVAPLETE
jgi:hypothetical protein